MKRLVALALLSLAARSDAQKQSTAACSPPSEVSDGSAAGRANVCLDKWAFRLAGAPDAAPTVALAVLGGCRSEVGDWVHAEILEKLKSRNDPGSSPEFYSEETGQVVTAQAAINERARAVALFFVVEARTHHCASRTP